MSTHRAAVVGYVNPRARGMHRITDWRCLVELIAFRELEVDDQVPLHVGLERVGWEHDSIAAIYPCQGLKPRDSSWDRQRCQLERGNLCLLQVGDTNGMIVGI